MGKPVGLCEGCPVGFNEGAALGLVEGLDVLGAWVGFDVGRPELGELVGRSVGRELGRELGRADGVPMQVRPPF